MLIHRKKEGRRMSTGDEDMDFLKGDQMTFIKVFSRPYKIIISCFEFNPLLIVYHIGRTVFTPNVGVVIALSLRNSSMIFWNIWLSL